MQFTLRQLQIFVMACDAGSLTYAAMSLGIAQSAVSTAIKTLEKALGVTLLVRVHATGVSPTPEGTEFLREARELLVIARQLEVFAEGMSLVVRGPVHVGSLVTVAPIVMPTLIRGFEERYPEAKVVLHEGHQEELFGLLRTGEISLAITYNIGVDNDVQSFTPLVAASPLVLLPAGHPLTEFDWLEIEQIYRQPMVLLDLPISRDYFLGMFRAEMRVPNIVHRSPHMDVVRSMVGQRMGYSLINLPPGTDQTMDGQLLETRPLRKVKMPPTLGAVRLYAPLRSANTRAFLDHAREWSTGKWGWVPGRS